MVNFTTPWERIDYVAWVNKASGLDITSYKAWDEKKLIADIKAKWIQFEWMDKMVVPTLIDYLYKKVLRPSITGPAFVYNYPKLMQPLARQSDNDENIVEQFISIGVSPTRASNIAKAITKASMEWLR